MTATGDPYDPFRSAREETGWVDAEVDGAAFTMFLRHADVRRICRDYGTFTSATPFRVPIPPEHHLRPTAQLPIESDPPQHGAYRRLMDAHFSRPAIAQHESAIRSDAAALVDDAVARGRIEVVGELGLPLFLRSLARVLGRPLDEAERWRQWGTQALAAVDAEAGHNSDMLAYIDDAADAALAEPGEDFFGHLARATIEGRALSRDEIRGFANLAFAGGRQTVVYALTNALHHLATHPDDRTLLAAEPERIPAAIEELLRFMTPIAHLGRTATRAVEVSGRDVPEGRLVSICFASANRDSREFQHADELRLDRKPNRHVAFGHGPHTCVGAPMARLILTVALQELLARSDEMRLAKVPVPHRDDVGCAAPQQGWDELVLRIDRHPPEAVGADRVR